MRKKLETDTNYEDIHRSLSRRESQGTGPDGSQYRKRVSQAEGLKTGMTRTHTLMS